MPDNPLPASGATRSDGVSGGAGAVPAPDPVGGVGHDPHADGVGQPGPGTLDALRQAAADAALTVPGVLRLEPTLANALHRLRTTTARAGHQPATSTAADGIRLTRRADLIDLHVDLTTATTSPADQTARRVHDVLKRVLDTHALVPGRVSVTVLRVNP